MPRSESRPDRPESTAWMSSSSPSQPEMRVPELRHDLVVDLRGALVDDQQGDVVFAHFTSDGGKGGLAGHLAVEQLVGFLHHDDQLAGLVLAGGAEVVGLFLPDLLILRVSRLRHQQVVQVGFVSCPNDRMTCLPSSSDLMISPMESAAGFSTMYSLSNRRRSLSCRASAAITFTPASSAQNATLSGCGTFFTFPVFSSSTSTSSRFIALKWLNQSRPKENGQGVQGGGGGFL